MHNILKVVVHRCIGGECGDYIYKLKLSINNAFVTLYIMTYITRIAPVDS